MIKTVLILNLLAISAFCSIRCGTSSSYCEGYETCCALSNGGYSCCPYVNGVCCAGEVRCCPSDRMCFGGQCVGMDSEEDNYLAALLSPSTMKFNIRKSE